MRILALQDIEINGGTLPSGRVIRLTTKRANKEKVIHGDKVELIDREQWKTFKVKDRMKEYRERQTMIPDQEEE